MEHDHANQYHALLFHYKKQTDKNNNNNKKDLNDQCLPGLGSLVHCPDTPSPQST